MTGDRVVLLVVHTGRDEATETARRVQKVLGDNGIGLRILTAEAVDWGAERLDLAGLEELGAEVVDAHEHAAAGCELVLVLGGDGTSRAAALGWRNAPLIPLSTGMTSIGLVVHEDTHDKSCIAGLEATQAFLRKHEPHLAAEAAAGAAPVTSDSASPRCPHWNKRTEQ